MASSVLLDAKIYALVSWISRRYGTQFRREDP